MGLVPAEIHVTHIHKLLETFPYNASEVVLHIEGGKNLEFPFSDT